MNKRQLISEFLQKLSISGNNVFHVVFPLFMYSHRSLLEMFCLVGLMYVAPVLLFHSGAI